ncbi:MAG: long-chain fatty acid--CoA ligase [Deltaproteobacteria bacterium]|nr:long-chain fatty acid--CoA ligase [Deltaproteobacteria bacterium]
MSEFHLAAALFERVGKYGDRTAVRYRQNDVWREISWNSFGEQIRAAAKALSAMGLGVQEMVAIFSTNRPEWTIADYAILALRGVVVPIHATNTPKQAEYILDEAEIGIAFVGGQEQYDRIRAIHGGVHGLRRIIVFDRAVDLAGEKNAVYFPDFLEEGRKAGGKDPIEARLREASLGDLVTLIYTSGTTGEPKGVRLHNTNFYQAFVAHEERLSVSDRDVSLCFLPLSHVFERTWSFFALHEGMTIVYCGDTSKVVEYLQQAHPTIMCAVPRFYEKIYSTVFEKLESAPPLKKRLFLWAIGVGWEAFLCKNEEKPLPLLLHIRHKIAEALVLKKIQGAVGGRIRFFPCAGAPLSKKIEEFFHAAGIRITYGYGLTETCATVTCHEQHHIRPGTVGKPIPGVQIRIGEAGEIQVKGETVTKGYYKKLAATAEAFTPDDWFRTGDVGIIEDGYLSITDRIKDLMKTSGGKYIAPQLVETLIGNDHYVDQVSIIGDLRKYVTALIVPAFEPLEEYARKSGIPFASHEELIRNPEVVKFYAKRIGENTKELASFEKVKRFQLLPRPFTQESGEMTPTMKLKRKVINEKYHDIIEQMYEERSSAAD